MKNPPKVSENGVLRAEYLNLIYDMHMQVVFEDQHGHRVAHNPGTLEDVDKA